MAMSGLTNAIDQMSEKQGSPIYIVVYNKRKRIKNKWTGKVREKPEPVMVYATKGEAGSIEPLPGGEYTPEKLQETGDSMLGMLIPVLQQMVKNLEKQHGGRQIVMTLFNESTKDGEGNKANKTVLTFSDKDGEFSRSDLTEVQEASKDLFDNEDDE